jgi:hypothetical protein
MQLVAYGAQDVYLTSNPQITFFRVVYRRHTNFAMESIEQVFNGSADFGRKVTATISRNGDLIHKTYLRVVLPDVTVQPGRSFRWLDWVGHALIRSVEIEIGGQRIDKHYGDWLHIWNELTQTAGHQIGYANMVGHMPQLITPVTNTNSSGGSTIVVPGQILWIPLEFWWNRNPGLALPLIALQYHEVKINLDLSPATNCYWAGTITPATTGSSPTPLTTTTDMSTASVTVPSLAQASLFVDYIYLDTDERRRFAQAAHEYLIEQLQYTGDESTSQTSNKIKLSFNHPTKELIWVIQPDDNVSDGPPMSTGPLFGKQQFNYSDGFDTTYTSTYALGTNNAIGDGALNLVAGMPGVAAGGANHVYVPTSFEGGANPVSAALLQLNGHDRFSVRDGRYFNLVEPYQHHENVPSRGINVYSFALKPEEHQPSGTCNFSRIDTAVLALNLTTNTVNKPVSSGSSTLTSRSAKVRVYAVNYNVLRVMSGMGGLAYSN